MELFLLEDKLENHEIKINKNLKIWNKRRNSNERESFHTKLETKKYLFPIWINTNIRFIELL
jgi:hypothetical protein